MNATATKQTQHFDAQGNEVFPCHCGETHEGDYAVYEYGHHNCLHEGPLRRLHEDLPDLICPACGLTFSVE